MWTEPAEAPPRVRSTLALRPCWGCGRSPGPGEEFGACGKCIKLKLVACTFCSQECLTAHAPRHAAWHEEQRELAKRLQATMPKIELPPDDRSLSEEFKEYVGLCRAAREYDHAGNLHKAAKKLRAATRLLPEEPAAYYELGNVLLRSNDDVGACENYLLAESRRPQHDADWASTIAVAFNTLRLCSTFPRPRWWNEADLLRLSEEAVAVSDKDEPMPWIMRGNVIGGAYDADGRKPRTLRGAT